MFAAVLAMTVLRIYSHLPKNSTKSFEIEKINQNGIFMNDLKTFLR